MQRGRCRAGIDACLNRRQSKPWQGAPLLTADDEFVGQGRCGSLSRGRKLLELLQPFQPTEGTADPSPSPKWVSFPGFALPQMRERSGLPSLKWGAQPRRKRSTQPWLRRTESWLTTSCTDHQVANLQGEKAVSATIGSGVAVFRRQMQQAGCLVLLFYLGELFHQIPGVLRRHLAIMLPFDARQFSGRHQGKTRLFNLGKVISMWPLPPSDVT